MQKQHEAKRTPMHTKRRATKKCQKTTEFSYKTPNRITSLKILVIFGDFEDFQHFQHFRHFEDFEDLEDFGDFEDLEEFEPPWGQQ